MAFFQKPCAPWAPRLIMYCRNHWLSAPKGRDWSCANCSRTRENSLGLQSSITLSLRGLNPLAEKAHALTDSGVPGCSLSVRKPARHPRMNWYTPCAYHPDCVLLYPPGTARPSGSMTIEPLRVERRYSPCNLKLVRVALPLGAHFHTASAIQTRDRPLNRSSRGENAESSERSRWSVAL